MRPDLMSAVLNRLSPQTLRVVALLVVLVLIILFFGSQIDNYFNARLFNRISTSVAIMAIIATGQALADKQLPAEQLMAIVEESDAAERYQLILDRTINLKVQSEALNPAQLKLYTFIRVPTSNLP